MASCKEVLHLPEVEQAPMVSFLDHPTELIAGQHLGQVEQRSGNRGDGDPVTAVAVVWV
jgi:hypothetical protein